MTLENILVAVFALFCLITAIIGGILLIKFLIIYPISCYYTKRGTNKLQWKAIETSFSRQARINGKLNSFLNDFSLKWRILPSELPYLIRIYGYNDWKDFGQYVYTDYIKFNNEKEFKDFVNKFKTLKDLREYYNKVDDKIIWYEP